ncbi:monovalent cation/H(+) antiporter subunit G [Niallia circulans]|jgi:multicomponent Na+:H+ antiporter subunit G|uniref:Monovalent cation/H(+) antiporter subunit G n=1 Tax=Niallia circulans TaxID=1397 RepID=A0A941JHN4_NIACI|nr:monovalent cation/H(+) antiporter subunit G [Niallia circulans]MCB5235979.1 monovalent cation/H(+) antiporter subunit G [Niallia circulans]
MTETLINIIIAILILLGALLSLIASIGVLRLPDVYTRSHAASKSATLGVMFILLGACLYFFQLEQIFNSRLILAIAFIFLTSPVAGQLIIRSAYNSEVPMAEETIRDDLKQAKDAAERSK